MRKITASILFAFCLAACHSSDPSSGAIKEKPSSGRTPDLVFRIMKFETDNLTGTLQFDTIAWNEKLDLDFYKKHFYRPYHYPQTFIDSQHKNETVVVWRDSAEPPNVITDWSHTYTYDSLARVTQYEYSGCGICSQMPFSWSIYYDDKNRPVRFEGGMGMINDEKAKSKKKDPDVYLIKYDINDDIVQIQFFRQGELMEQIDRLLE